MDRFRSATILPLTRQPGAPEGDASRLAPSAEQALDLQDIDIRLLQQASEGFVDKSAAEKVKLAPDAVHERWRRIRRVLGAKNRSHAVAIALGLGLIPVPAQVRLILARR
ncbi:MAG: helix-turn-helix transcriptional regulator [Caulobacterales bacterium]